MQIRSLKNSIAQAMSKVSAIAAKFIWRPGNLSFLLVGRLMWTDQWEDPLSDFMDVLVKTNNPQDADVENSFTTLDNRLTVTYFLSAAMGMIFLTKEASDLGTLWSTTLKSLDDKYKNSEDDQVEFCRPAPQSATKDSKECPDGVRGSQKEILRSHNKSEKESPKAGEKVRCRFMQFEEKPEKEVPAYDSRGYFLQACHSALSRRSFFVLNAEGKGY